MRFKSQILKAAAELLKGGGKKSELSYSRASELADRELVLLSRIGTKFTSSSIMDIRTQPMHRHSINGVACAAGTHGQSLS